MSLQAIEMLLSHGSCFPCGSAGKESACNAGDLGWEDPLEKGKAPTPVFWPGEFHRLYSPWGRKESDTTERLSHWLSLWPWGKECVTDSKVKVCDASDGAKAES